MGDPASPSRRRSATGRTVDKDIGFALHEPFEGHALVEINPVLHYQVLMAGMEHFGVSGRHDVDREIVGADDANPLVRQPARAFEPDPRGAVVKSGGLGGPARAVSGAHERRVARSDRRPRSRFWRSRQALRSASLISSPTSSTRPFSPCTSNNIPRVKNGGAFSMPKPLEAIGRPHVAQPIAVVEPHIALIAHCPTLTAKMAERVHVGADLADFRAEIFVVPDGPADFAIGAAGRSAGHAQGKGAARSERHRRLVGMSETDDLAGLDQTDRLQHFRRAHEVAGAALVVRTPRRGSPIQPARRVVGGLAGDGFELLIEDSPVLACCQRIATALAARSASAPRCVRRCEA